MGEGLKRARAAALLTRTTAEDHLYAAVERYVRENGGGVVVIGGVEVQDWEEGKFNFRLAVRCTGKRPQKSTSVVMPEPERCACGVVSRGLVDGVCADCRQKKKNAEVAGHE